MVKQILIAAVGFLSLIACGVKGPPQPPLAPPEIGRGKPSLVRDPDHLALPNVPPVESVPDDPDSSKDKKQDEGM